MSAPAPRPEPPLGRALELLLPEPAAGRSLSPPARPDPQPTRLWRWNSSVWRRRRLPVAAVLGCLCSHHAASGAGCVPQHDRSARHAQRSPDAPQPQPLLVVHLHPFWHCHAPLLPAGLPAGGRACAPLLHTCPPGRAHSTSCTKHLTPLCCGKHTDLPPLLPALSSPFGFAGGDDGYSYGGGGTEGYEEVVTVAKVQVCGWQDREGLTGGGDLARGAACGLPHHRLPCCIL